LRPSAKDRAVAFAGVVTPVAWGVLVLSVVALFAGRRTGWVELIALGTTGSLLMLGALAFTVGRSELDVELEVLPQRVQAGQRSAAQVTVRNPGAGRQGALTLELTVGEGAASVRVPALSAGASHDEVFILPTVRRAIIPVGPVASVRSDPLGLLRRSRSWVDPVPLYVHPRTVALPDLGTGLIRDLEGRATTQVSPADIAFHTLREYETGDDRRFVHWLTSARTGKLMVRQFVDTRRSHVAVVVDGAAGSYPDPDDFEMAVSVAASLGARVLLDEQDLSMVVAGDRIPTASGTAMLDALCAVDVARRGAPLTTQVNRLFRYAGGLSLAVVVSGSEATVAEMRAAMRQFPDDVRVLGVRAPPNAVTGFQPLGANVLVTLGSLDDLPRIVWAVAA
jgi:uncharacterized protein (DUF58 family)